MAFHFFLFFISISVLLLTLVFQTGPVMKVLKFGGSSLDSPQKVAQVRKIIESQSDQVIIVISALHGITDELLELSKQAASRDRNFFRLYNEIEIRHTDLANSIFKNPLHDEVVSHINAYLKDLISIINGVYLLNDLTPKIQDKILSFGEILSSYIISKAIDNAELIDAKSLIKTDSHFGMAKVNFPLY